MSHINGHSSATAWQGPRQKVLNWIIQLFLFTVERFNRFYDHLGQTPHFKLNQDMKREHQFWLMKLQYFKLKYFKLKFLELK